MESRIFISGSRGYIGSHFIKRLLKSEQYLQHLQDGFMHCDLTDGWDFGKLTGCKFNTVVHLAAHASVTQSLENPDECLENNAFKLIPFLTRNEIGKIIFTSTGGAIYGEKHFAKEEDASWSGCISPYGQSKYLAEKIIRQLQPNHTILRLGNVYGGDDSYRLESAAHLHFKKDNPIVVYGGDQTRDFVDIDDVCEAIIRAIYSDITGTFNIGSGLETKVADIAQSFAASRNVPIIYRPGRQGEITNISLDVGKAKKAGLL